LVLSSTLFSSASLSPPRVGTNTCDSVEGT
jgi:hypothetical protein